MFKKLTIPLLFLFLTGILFYKYFIKGLLPIPADIITGVYYPWLDYKWGNIVGVIVKNPLMSDIPSLIYPWRTLAINLIKNSQWPLWNQYSFSGYPLLGNWQSAPFSPANIFYFFLNEKIAWSLGIIFQPFLAGLFMYLWLKTKKLTILPSTLGGILYAFSGFHITWMFYNTHQWTTLWLPLILLSIDKIVEGKTKWNLWLSLWIALSILSGYPIILIYEALIITIYLISKLYEGGGFSYRKIPLLQLTSAILLALGLSAIQWLPGIETIKNSIHNLDQSTLNSANQGFLPLQNFITAIAPDYFGDPSTYNYWGIGYYDNWAFYISIGALIIATIAFIKIKTSRIWFFLSITGLLLATNNPIGNIIRKNLILLENSIPSRGLFLFDFGIAVSSAYGLQCLLKTKSKKLIQPIFLTLGIFILIFTTIWINTLHSNFLNIASLATNQNIALRNLILPTAIFTIIGVTLLIILKLPNKFKPVLMSLIIIVISSDLFRYGWKYLPFTQSNYLYPPTEITNWLQQKKETENPFRIEFGEVIPQNMWIPYHLESPGGYDALMSLRYAQFLEAIQSNKLSNSINRFPTIENFDNPLFQLTNTKYILALKYNDKWERKTNGTIIKEIYNRSYLQPVYQYKTVTILENQNFLPRAFIVPNAKIIQNDTELITKLTDPKTDFHQTVYLSQQTILQKTKNASPKYQITWNKSEGQTQKLTITSDQSGYLVLLEAYDPGWNATIITKGGKSKLVNGEYHKKIIKTKPLRSNFTFMSIPIEQGTSEITLTYFPKSFRYGLWVTGFSLILWFALWFNNNKRKIIVTTQVSLRAVEV